MPPERPQSVASGAITDLVVVMDRLRRECAWTGQQTHESLSEYVVEEAAEVVDAIASDDSDHLREELGDLLLQVVFHARIAQEDHGWGLDDVARELTAKLIRRNPHVFGDATASTPAEIDAQWRRIKAEEKRSH